MPSTISLTGDWLVSLGNRRQTSGTGNLGVYATNGVAVSAPQVGLGVIQSLVIQPAGGYTFEYISSTGKVKAYVTGAATPAGTISVPTFTGTASSLTATSSKPTFTVESAGSIGTNMEVGLSVDTDAATFEGGTGITAQRVLTTTSPVGTPTITPGAYTPTGVVSAPTFTGDAQAAAVLAEVANSTNLAGVTFTFVAIGY